MTAIDRAYAMAQVLIVDDDANNRELVVALVRQLGHTPLEASGGAQALALARAHLPKLIISDIVMPVMDGYELVRQLRADPQLAATEVIFYSAHYDAPEARRLARACGVSRMLAKPSTPQEILNTVERALAQGSESVPVQDNQAFDRDHRRLLTDKLSEQVTALQAANRHLAALTELNLQLASERDPQTLLDKVCHGARELLGAQYAVLGVQDPQSNALRFSNSAATPALLHGAQPPAWDHGLLGQVRQQGRTLRMANPQGDPAAIGLPGAYPPLHNGLVAPLASLSHTYGWICLANKQGQAEFSSEDEQLLAALAAQVGRAYENDSLYASVQRHAEQLQTEINERQRATDELRTSEAGLHLAQMMARLSYVITGPAGVFESWPGTLPQMLMLDPPAMPATTRDWLQKLVHPDDRALFRATALQAGLDKTRMDFEYRLRRTDGVWLHVRQIMEPLAGEMATGKTRRWFNTIQDITQQKQAQEALRESERRFSDMLANLDMVAVMLDRDARITYCNDYLLRLTGWTREEVLGCNWFEVFMPPELGDMRPVFQALLASSPEAMHRDQELYTRAKLRRLVRWNNTVLRSPTGEVTGSASIGEDITDRREAENKITRLNRVYAVLSGINALIVRVRERDELFREACRIAVNEGKFRMAWIGTVAHEAIQVVTLAIAGESAASAQQRLQHFTLANNSPLGGTLALRALRAKRALFINDLLEDEHLPVDARQIEGGCRSIAMLPLLVNAEVSGVLALYSGEADFFDAHELELLTELAGDISFALDHIAKADKLNYLAYYDEVTGLPNRTLFLERVSQHLRTRGPAKSQLALALVDIERFRTINDTLGRLAGDELLRMVAQRIQASDLKIDTVARVGINCFGIVIHDPRDAADVALTLELLLHACFSKSLRLHDTDLRIAGKVGISMCPSDGQDADALLLNAEAALKRAKASAEPLLFYAPEMNARVAQALNLESKLRTALDLDQFVLHYQPKVDIASGQVTSAEALIRWNDPDTGLVPPVQFIPMLEETGLIYDVGRWALRRAVEDNLRWHAAGLQPVRIAVNVSPLQLRHRSFVQEVQQVVSVSPHAAAGLELEITESQIMEDMLRNIENLNAIRAMGISIAIDDFGTGYSSLAHLARLPADKLKIDRSFILEMSAGPQGQALVATIIDLAHSLKLKVIAEGVETQEQLDLLRALECDEMQGFLFSKPVPADVFEAKFLRQLHSI